MLIGQYDSQVIADRNRIQPYKGIQFQTCQHDDSALHSVIKRHGPVCIYADHVVEGGKCQ